MHSPHNTITRGGSTIGSVLSVYGAHGNNMWHIKYMASDTYICTYKRCSPLEIANKIGLAQSLNQTTYEIGAAGQAHLHSYSAAITSHTHHICTSICKCKAQLCMTLIGWVAIGFHMYIRMYSPHTNSWEVRMYVRTDSWQWMKCTVREALLGNRAR